jgi:septal ring factor EnvC (AmiA/AmiB activator)
MGIIMVVQAVSENVEPIELIEIPEKLPSEIIEHDSFLMIESNLNDLEDKVQVTAKSLLSMSYELKTQITEITRLENAVLNMHEFIGAQNDKIMKLEDNYKKLQNSEDERIKKSKAGFWERLFNK